LATVYNAYDEINKSQFAYLEFYIKRTSELSLFTLNISFPILRDKTYVVDYGSFAVSTQDAIILLLVK
jgi:hypothetical protein